MFRFLKVGGKEGQKYDARQLDHNGRQVFSEAFGGEGMAADSGRPNTSAAETGPDGGLIAGTCRK